MDSNKLVNKTSKTQERISLFLKGPTNKDWNGKRTARKNIDLLVHAQLAVHGNAIKIMFSIVQINKVKWWGRMLHIEELNVKTG